MKSVSFIIYEQMLASSVTLPLEQLKSAEAMSLANRTSPPKPPIRFELVSQDGRAIKTHSGLSFDADKRLSDIQETDLVYLPALWRNPQTQVKLNPELPQWLQYIYRQGATIAGVGTGCCFLAESGLLDGQVATTHWHYFDDFQKNYPNVKLQRNYFITASDRIYCTGSTNSLADLTVYFIRNHFGEVIANNVERHFFHEIRQNYLKTASENNKSGIHSDEVIARIQSHIKENITTTIDMKILAGQFELSVRTFNRRFKNATGKTPMQYIQHQRITMAADLLKNTNLTVGEISFAVGYFDLAHFNTLFKREFNITPNKYRTTLRAKLFTVDSRF